MNLVDTLIADAVHRESFLIAAVADNGVIGSDGTIPWHLSADMRHFRESTMGCALVVGRTTFDSLPKDMPGRTLVVVTTRPLPEGSAALSAPTFEEAVRISVEDTGCRAVAFAGGVRIYEAAMRLPWLRRIVLTRVAASPEGDARMPPIGEGWRTASVDPMASREGEPAARIETLIREPLEA